MLAIRGMHSLTVLSIILISYLVDCKQTKRNELENELSNEVDLGPAYPSPHKQELKWRILKKGRDKKDERKDKKSGRINLPNKKKQPMANKMDMESLALQKLDHGTGIRSNKKKIHLPRTMKKINKKNKMYKKITKQDKRIRS